MDKTRDEMNGNQRMLLSYLESLVPADDVLMGLSTIKRKRLSNAERRRHYRQS